MHTEKTKKLQTKSRTILASTCYKLLDYPTPSLVVILVSAL